MSNYVKSLTFCAEGPDYVLMADHKGRLIRVEGLSAREVDGLAGRLAVESPIHALFARIKQLS